MQVFIAAVSVALIVSFLCSIFESVLLSINHAQVESLAQQGKRSGQLLKEFKRRIDMPIAAILITNTIAHTIGTAVAGATYEDAFNSETLWIFTIVFTTAILLFTEIIPKTLGVTHAKRLAETGCLRHSRTCHRFTPACSLEWGNLPIAPRQEERARDLRRRD